MSSSDDDQADHLTVAVAVADLEDVVGRMRQHGAGPVGEGVQHEDTYRLGSRRGLDGIVVALAEELR